MPQGCRNFTTLLKALEEAEKSPAADSSPHRGLVFAYDRLLLPFRMPNGQWKYMPSAGPDGKLTRPACTKRFAVFSLMVRPLFTISLLHNPLFTARACKFFPLIFTDFHKFHCLLPWPWLVHFPRLGSELQGRVVPTFFKNNI